MRLNTPLFKLGRTVATPGAIEAARQANQPLDVLIRRHVTGDFGVVDAEDWETNEQAIQEGSRILSAYILPNTEERIWIITEADRSSTCCLLPSEY